MLVDIGYKSEGVIPVSELSIRRSVNPEDEVSVGDDIAALVLTKEDADGRLILSKKRARFEIAWKAIETAHEKGEPVTGRVIEVVKGGLILDLGVRGFLPASLVDIRRVQDLDEFLGQELECKVIELNRSRNNVVLSRRAVLEEERKEQRQRILDRLNPGNVVEGTISNIVDFGAFVDLDGMDGLIHISELSWSHVNHPSEVLEIGQTVKVQVLDIDRERQRISLGLKQTQTDPWQQVLESYQEGDVVQGTVTKVVTFGAFVEILPGVEGLVHISELAQHHVENPREIVSQGDQVNVRILEVDADRRRLSLSLKRVEDGMPVQPKPGEEASRPRSASPTRSSPTRFPPPRRSRRRLRSRAARRGRAGAEEPVAEVEAEVVAEPEAEPVAEVEAEVVAEPRPSRSKRSRSKQPWPSRELVEEPEPEADAAPEAEAGSEPARGRSGRGSRRLRRGAGRIGMRRPLAVALTGGIAAGKSEALQAFARHGAATISSDDVVHRLYREDEELRTALRERWGDGVFHDGEVDRAEIGLIVFADRAELAWLEAELHPRVRQAVDAWLAEQTADVAVAEIPLLYETGGEARFDRVVVVTAPPEVREARRGRAADREARLVPEEEKVRRADFSYVNDGSLEELDAFVAGVLEELRRSLRRWVVVVAAVVVAVGAFVYLQHTEPPWYARLWYPLRYADDRPRPREREPPRSRAARGGDRDGEQVQPERPLQRRRRRAHAADAEHGEGHRALHARQPLPPLRPHEPRHQRALRRVVPPPPARPLPGQRAARPRRLQRRRGQRRPLAERARGDPVRRDAGLREQGRAAEEDLPPRVRVPARILIRA